MCRIRMEVVLGRGEYVYSSTAGCASGTDALKNVSTMSAGTVQYTASGARC
jgi:hypothetical protein